MTTAGYTVGWLAEYVAGLEYAAERGAIEEYLYEVDAEFTFNVDAAGNFAGAMVTLAGNPRINFNSDTGIVRARSTSPHHTVVAWQRLTNAAREEFNAYFAEVFELAQVCEDFTA